MTTCLGKSCSFGLPRVAFVNCPQFMYLVPSLSVLRAGYGIVSVPDLCLLFYFENMKTMSRKQENILFKRSTAAMFCFMTKQM